MTDIDDLLSSILDDSKPMPVVEPRQPTAAQVTLHVARNSGNHKAEAELAMDDPTTYLDALLNEKLPKPEAKALVEQIVASEPHATARLAKAVATPQASVDTDEDWLDGILNGSAKPPVTPVGGLPATPLQVTVDAIDGSGEIIGTSTVIVGPNVTAGIFSDSEERTEPQLKPLAMPVFTSDDFAETMDIRNFATLVTLNTARWHAKVKDRQAGKDIATANDADAGAFETRKHLLGGASDKLKAIHRAIDEARAAHYEMTLPWTTTSMQDTGRRVGGRLLPNTLFVDYTTVMAQKKAAMRAALDVFEPEYPAMIEAAKKKLGKRFDAREYPNVSSIRAHFDLSFDFQPIPKGDDFKGLPQVQLDALANKVNDNTRLMAENAMQDVWSRTYEAVARMAERLSSPDKTFHNSLVQNVRDVARLMSHLNVAQDPRVENIRKKIEKHLCGAEPKDLREKITLRTEVAAHAASIIQEMDK